MDSTTLISIAVAALVMGGIAWFTFTKVGRSGGTKVSGKGSGDTSGRK